jgi:hypothetical protein
MDIGVKSKGSTLLRQASAAGFSAAVLLMLAVPARATITNFVSNGSFENTNGASSSFEITDSNLPGWTIVDATMNTVACVVFPGTATSNPCGVNGLVLWGGTTSPDGGNFVAIDGGSQYTATISQTITGLISGQTYQVSFDMATSQLVGYAGATENYWQVSLGSQILDSSIIQNPSEGSTPWITQSLTFTATGVTEALSFFAEGTPNSEPPMLLLDGVTLDGQMGGSAPEPATFALLGIGLAGVFAAARRLRKRA